MSRELSEISRAKFKMIRIVAAEREGIGELSDSNVWGNLLKGCRSSNKQKARQYFEFLKELFGTGIYPTFLEVSQPCERGSAFCQWLLLLDDKTAAYAEASNETDDLKFLVSWGKDFIKQANKGVLSQVLSEKAGLIKGCNIITVVLNILHNVVPHNSLITETQCVLGMTTDIFANCDNAVLSELIFEKTSNGSLKGCSPFSLLANTAWDFFTTPPQENAQAIVVSLIQNMVKRCATNVLSNTICCTGGDGENPYNVILMLTVMLYDVVNQQSPVISVSVLLVLLEEIFIKCDATVLSHAISKKSAVFKLRMSEQYVDCNVFCFMTAVLNRLTEKKSQKEAACVLRLMQVLFEEKNLAADKNFVSQCIAGNISSGDVSCDSNVATLFLDTFSSDKKSSANRAVTLSLFETMVFGCDCKELPNIFSKTTNKHAFANRYNYNFNAFGLLLAITIHYNDNKELVLRMIDILSYVVQQCNGQDFLNLLIIQSTPEKHAIFEDLLSGVFYLAKKCMWKQAESLFAIVTDIVQRIDAPTLSELILSTNVHHTRNAFFHFTKLFHFLLNGPDIVETSENVAARSAMHVSVKSCLELVAGKCGDNNQRFISGVSQFFTEEKEKKSFEAVKSLMFSISQAAQDYHVSHPMAALMSSEFPTQENKESALVVHKTRREKIGYYPAHAVGFMWMLMLAESIKLKGHASADVVLPFDIIWNIAQFSLTPNQKILLDLTMIDPKTKKYHLRGVYDVWLSTFLSELDGLTSTEVDKKRGKLLLADMQCILNKTPLDFSTRQWNMEKLLDKYSPVEDKIYCLLCMHYNNLFPKEKSPEMLEKNTVVAQQGPTMFGKLKSLLTRERERATEREKLATFKEVLVAGLRTFPGIIPEKQSLAASPPPATQKKQPK